MSHGSAGLDRAALEQLFVRLEGPLYNVVLRWIWEPEEAHEIVQETFVRLWDMRARVRDDTIDALVYRIAVNLARKRRRWRRMRHFFGLQEDRWAHGAPRADADLARHERDVAIHRAVEALPEDLRTVVMLCHFSDLSYREVASILNIPEGTVGSRRNRALQQLRTTLGSEPALEHAHG